MDFNTVKYFYILHDVITEITEQLLFIKKVLMASLFLVPPFLLTQAQSGCHWP